MAGVFKTRRDGLIFVEGTKKADSDKQISRREVQALLNAAKSDKTPHAPNAYDVFCVAANLGLRSEEIRRMDFEDARYLRFNYLVVHTAKKRMQVEDRLYLGNDESNLMWEIFERRRKLIRGKMLFPFGTRTIRHYWAYYAEKAGIHPNVSFHSLRHFAAHEITDAGNGNVGYAKVRLRHTIGKDPTLIYTLPTSDQMIAAANKKGVIR